jgi:hypothetical protein
LRGGDPARNVFLCDTLELLLRGDGECEWRVPRMRGSSAGALPRGGPKAGRAQHAAWALRDDGNAAALLCVHGGYAPGTSFFRDLRCFDAAAGTWARCDYTAGGDGDGIVPRCRCGHSATPLDASGRVVALWGGAADSPRHELLLLTLSPPEPASPPPHAPPVASPPHGEDTAALAETQRALVLLERSVLSALQEERLSDAEASALAWLARAQQPHRGITTAQLLASEALSPAEQRTLRVTMRKARMLNALGLVCRLTGRYADARAHYEGAIALLEALPPPLDASPDGEEEMLASMHNNAAQLCRTQAVADAPGFLRHMRAAMPRGSARESDAELLRVAQVGQLDEAALRRERTRNNVELAARTGFTTPNPRAWVLRCCDGCGARESEPGQFKHCAACGGAVYCGKACQAAQWKAHKAACKAAQAGKQQQQGGT